jgi:hypothetical protein
MPTSGLPAAAGVPETKISPASGCSRPAASRSSVVFPLPFAPSSATHSPGSSVSEAP